MELPSTYLLTEETTSSCMATGNETSVGITVSCFYRVFLSESVRGGFSGNALSLWLGLRAYGHKPCKTRNRAHYSSYEIFYARNNNSRYKTFTAVFMVVAHSFLPKLKPPIKELPNLMTEEEKFHLG